MAWNHSHKERDKLSISDDYPETLILSGYKTNCSWTKIWYLGGKETATNSRGI